MRLNKYLAQATGMSRRAADTAIQTGRVTVNSEPPTVGQEVGGADRVVIDHKPVKPVEDTITIMLNKSPGYVCSRDGQGSQTIYDLLPNEFYTLKPVGRLDKNSSGLLLLTNDGQLAYELTHPKFQKTKVYKIALNKPLEPLHQQIVSIKGVMLDDGLSKLQLDHLNKNDHTNWKITMSEGRNRQIRRSFEALGYKVVKLHRTQFGPYTLGELKVAKYSVL